MKKIFYLSILALVALALPSCNKSIRSVETPGEVVNTATGNVTVTLNTLENPSTKALSSNAAESKINAVHVFIFDKTTGKRETDRFEQVTGTVNGSYTMTLTSLTGLKEVWAVVNAPRIVNVENVTALKQKVSDLGENSITNLLMTGYNANVDIQETNANIASQASVVTNADINVSRLGARISLNNVIVDFTNTDLEGATFAVTGLYLKNVVGSICMDGTSSGINLTWYNMSNQSNVLAAPAAIQALTKDMPISLACNSAGTQTALGYSWYVYPNATTAGQDSNAEGVAAPRRTRLVIKAHLSGTSVGGALDEDTYYVLSIPEIRRNYAYNINTLKITMRGKPNDDSDEPTNSGAVSATITVQGWESEQPLEYNL